MRGWENGDSGRLPSLIGSPAQESEILEVLARLEADRLAGRDRHLDTGLGIAADALLAVADLEDAEAAELDALAVAERALHGFDDGIDGLRRLHPGHIRDFRDAVDDVRLDHCGSETGASLKRVWWSVNKTEILLGLGLFLENTPFDGGGGGGGEALHLGEVDRPAGGAAGVDHHHHPVLDAHRAQHAG